MTERDYPQNDRVMLKLLIYLFVFIFGCCWGSFLNCLIYRLEKGEGFVKKRSACPKCKRKLIWKDLLPIVSFCWLGGKCRYCKKKISWQYPAVEIATGLVFLLIFNFKFLIFNQFLIFNFKTLAELFYCWLVACFLIIIFVYDLRHYIIPDWAVYPAIGLVFVYQLFANYNSFFNFLLAGIGVAGFFFAIWLVSKGRAMGFGDVKLAFLMGLLLGFPKILLAVFVACFSGSLLGLALIVLGKKKLKSALPFAPFLVAGTFAVLFWGEQVIKWYLSYMSF